MIFSKLKKGLVFELALLAVIIFLGFLVRTYRVNNPIADWHSWRQADTASVARFFADSGFDLLHPRYHDISSVATGYNNPQGFRYVEFPIYNAIHAFLYKNFGGFSFDAWGRLTSIISSLISVIFVYLIGRRFLGTSGGLVAAAIFTFLPFNIFFSRVVLPEPLAVTAILSSLWFFILWIDRQKFWQLILSAVLFTLALSVKPYTVFWAVPMTYLVLAKFGLKAFFNPRLFIFLAAALIPFFLWRGFMNQHIEGIPHWLWAFNGDEIRFKPSWWWWIFEERLGRLILGTFLVVPFCLGFLFKSRNFPWFFQSAALGQFLYFATIATANVRHDYYQTLSVPSFALLAGAGTVTLWNLKIGDDLLRRLLVLGTLAAGFAFSFYQVKEFYKINHPEIIVAGQAVDRLLPREAKVIAPYNGDTAFLYQTRRSGWPHATLPMPQMIERLGAEYYVSVNFDKQTQEVMEKYQVVEKTEQHVIIKLQ